MDTPLPISKREHYWQLGLYAVSVALMAWDLLARGEGLTIWGLYSGSVFLLLACPLLGVSWLLAVKSLRLGARGAFVASALGLVPYLGKGFTSLVDYPSESFDIARLYLPRVLSIGATLLYSQKVLRSEREQAEGIVRILFFRVRWTPARQKYAVTAFILVVGILGVQWLYPRISCVASGGEWVRDGIFGQAQYCLRSYPDAGKVCQSSKECMGACVLVNYSPSATAVPTAGVCQSDNRPFGCYDYLEYPKVFSVCSD